MMSRVRVVTSFSPAGYEVYGRRFLRCFEEYFDPEIRLSVYAEQGVPMSALPAGTTVHNMLDGSIPALTDFLERHSENPMVCGKVVRPGWKTGDVAKGYCYRFDAVKFCRKVFAIQHAMGECKLGDLLVWIDADTYAHHRITEEFLWSMVGDDDAAYLGRARAHSECGFLAFRMYRAMPLIHRWADFYRDDTFHAEAEWHDSFLFDRAREKLPHVFCRNIAEPGAVGHVWFHSPLGQVMDHLKGDRKQQGFSMEMQGLVHEKGR